ncbi:MAG: acetolactate synthase-1/2/3 large subunit [Cellvibrionaceae bacterium]
MNQCGAIEMVSKRMNIKNDLLKMRSLFQNKSAQTKPFNSAEIIIEYLEHIGVEYVFGVPGGTIEPIYDALARSSRRGGPKPVNACHESAAAYMADGYYRETGKLGVCIATSGPGATNLITGVACAYDNNIPMLVLTGQPAIPSFGKGALQESACSGVNILGMFRHCTRYNSLVSHQDQLERKLANALLTAFQSKGPTHLSLPVDILREAIDRLTPRYNLSDKLDRNLSIMDEESVDELVTILRNKKKPVFFIGSGAVESIDAIMMLVNITQALFVTTPDAKGLINPLHQSYRGVFGLGGHDSAIDTLQNNRSVTLAFGTGFGEFSTNNWSESLLNEQLIHIDDTSDNLLRSPMARLHVLGRILTICNRLVDQLLLVPRKATKTSASSLVSKNINPYVSLQEPDKYYSNATPIKPQRLMKELSERFPPSTRFLADAGNSMMWAPHYLQPQNRREQQLYNKSERRSGNSSWLRLTLNFAPMGWAIGAAVGVARGNPDCPTVCITGDGAYLMSGQEITIAAQEKLPVVFVILNDGVYGMVMHGQRLAGAEPISFNLQAVNFCDLAKAMGIHSFLIESPDDFDQLVMKDILTRKGPTLLDVRIDREEIPPMVSRLKTLGTIE